MSINNALAAMRAAGVAQVHLDAISAIAMDRMRLRAALRDVLGTCGPFSPQGKNAFDAARKLLAEVQS